MDGFEKSVGFSDSDVTVREGLPSDVDFLIELEEASFVRHRQSTERSLRNLHKNPRRQVFVAEAPDADTGAVTPAGAVVLILNRKSVRIYSIAVVPACRRRGIGELLLRHTVAFATAGHYKLVTLEVDADNQGLVDWYRKNGFAKGRLLEDYYAPDEPAWRMARTVGGKGGSGSERFLIVTDDTMSTLASFTDLPVVSAHDYLADPRYARSTRYHVLNFCASYKTHSMGYYVSLLASARTQRVTPSVMTVKDSARPSIAQSLLEEIGEFVDHALRKVGEERFELTVVLGKTTRRGYGELGKKLFSLFELPFFTLLLERNGSWRVRKVSPLAPREVMRRDPDLFRSALAAYTEQKRYRRARLKNFTYDLAILVNDREPTPPSDKEALKKFRKAAEEVGFFVEFVTKADRRRIAEFDALFIRETTALNNHTYAMARHAYTEGLVVVDDPWSILLCSNKVYLHERLENAGLRQPKGWLLTRRSIAPEFLGSLPYPVALKLPESSFSLGVYRVDGPDELAERARELLAKSDLVIAQEFLPTDYDWRIGVLDNAPLFACKYFMADGHWQVYNWGAANPDEAVGRHETVPIEEVPAPVVKAALKAASLIGNGFYGVDLKEADGKVFIIEVNDNPNVDAGVEDALAGDELYRTVMRSIYARIESERRQVRYIR